MPVKIVYDPDDSAGRVPNKNIKHRSLVNGKVINVKMGTPDDYKKVLQTKSSTQRLSVNPDVPKTLTPKGYTKMQLMMGIAQKKYDNIVRKLKGTNSLWEDPDFPLNSAIGNIGNLPRLEWKRPKEINPRADFIVAGADRGDVVQGQLGDCWLLAVISSMADITELFNHIVPKGQTIQGPDYVGVFKFRFWRFGQWVEVLVDDRLPVVAGTNEMIFMHSDECNEFWSPLMEKAYAKLNGCYANLSGGTQGEAMEDMTGGLVESLDLKKVPGPEFYSDVHKYLKRCCLMGCSITSKEIEAKLNNGLIAGHAYSVNDLEDVTYKGSKVHLLRVRNPWGNNYEWKGDWSDNAPQWRDVSEADKTRLHLRFAADGEFWMSMDDFMKCFTKLEVCHLGHESLEEGMTVKGKKRLEETFFSGEWVKNVNAGGCANFRDTYWTNPQYKITVTDPDPTDDQDKSTVVIGLMQKNVRKRGGGNFFTIGFCVYKIPSNTEGLLKRDFFNTNRPISISEFTNTREVVVKLRVMPGCYLIVPSTFNPNQEAQFIIRVFTETIIKESECDDKNSFKGLSEEMVKAIKEAEKTKNEDDFVDSLFNSAKDPVTNSINAEQLRDILNKSTMKSSCTDPNGFQLEAVRSMLASMDNNMTGKMEYDEFKRLWENCQCWRDVFAQRDRDASKTLNVTELREALMSAGFHLSGLVFTVVVQRFVTQKLNAVTFEDWLICCVRLKNSFETMKAQFKTNDGNLMFTEDDFLRLTINQ
uniref:Calpain n=1 Tax=Echinococcus granulosus TaxID=6210 RepID=A0A068WYE1_ECHGR|nr:calpain [Echinococcus granulosus]